MLLFEYPGFMCRGIVFHFNHLCSTPDFVFCLYLWSFKPRFQATRGWFSKHWLHWSIRWWRGFKKRKDEMLCFWGVAGELPKRQSPAQPRWLWLCWLLWLLLKLWNGASLSLERRLRVPVCRVLVPGTLNRLLSWTSASTGRVVVLEYMVALKCLLPSCRSSFIEDKWSILCCFHSWLLEVWTLWRWPWQSLGIPRGRGRIFGRE